MDDLIKALEIFKGYSNEQWPTSCEHDVLYIMAVLYDEVSEDHKTELEKLGFIEDTENGGFLSFKFGSA